MKFKQTDISKLKTLMKSGYVYAVMPQHPCCDKQGRVCFHRLVMENKLGRYLAQEEAVHHIDEDILNNLESNLMLFSSNSDHISFHSAQRKIYTTCDYCGKVFNAKGRNYCSTTCAGISRKGISKQSADYGNRIVWPTNEELEKMLWERPSSSVAADLGVSDAAICKRCRKYNIEKPPRGYWAKKYAGKI